MITQFISFVAAVALLIFWIWMFLDMAKNPRIRDWSRFYWAFCFVLLGVLTALYYYLTEYRRKE